MKRIIIYAALLLSCFAASAQEKPEMAIKLGGGGTTLYAIDQFGSGSSRYSYSTLQDVYSSYYGPIYTSGDYSLALDMMFKKRLGMTIDLGVTALWKDQYDGVSKKRTETKNCIAIHFMPSFKAYYLKRDFFKMYGTIGVGACKFIGCENLTYTNNYVTYDNSFQFAFQMVPLGLEFGGKFFGFVEGGLGTIYMGMKVGLGYRF